MTEKFTKNDLLKLNCACAGFALVELRENSKYVLIENRLVSNNSKYASLEMGAYTDNDLLSTLDSGLDIVRVYSPLPYVSFSTKDREVIWKRKEKETSSVEAISDFLKVNDSLLQLSVVLNSAISGLNHSDKFSGYVLDKILNGISSVEYDITNCKSLIEKIKEEHKLNKN